MTKANLRIFGFGKVFATWDLATDPVGFPYVYPAVISLADKDDGGFYKFLTDLWDQVRDKVLAAVKEAVAGAIGAAEIGAVLGTIASACVAAIIAWIIDLFSGTNVDDIIGVKAAYITLGACTKSYYDWAQLTMPEGYYDTLHLKDDGYYRVGYSFKVFPQ